MLNPEFRDILSAFAEEDVEFLVVGAYALAAHGVPRATGHLDLWIRRSPDNADRVLRALQAFGAPTADLTEDDLVSADIVFQIGVEPRRIDILTSVDGVEFDAAWANREQIEVEGLELPVLGLTDLITNKRALGRPQDLADVARLEEEGS